jgi:hypothetical protein
MKGYQNTHAVLQDIFLHTFSQRTKHETQLSESCEVAVLCCAISRMALLMTVLKLLPQFQSPIFHLLSPYGGSTILQNFGNCLLIGYCPKDRGGRLSEIWKSRTIPSETNAVLKELTTVITAILLCRLWQSQLFRTSQIYEQILPICVIPALKCYVHLPWRIWLNTFCVYIYHEGYG